MMKRKLRRIISCFLTLCLLAVSLNYLTNLMERKESITKHQPFFKQKADFDVLFFGTSHVVNGVFPMELWNDYGIVSYNFGENNCLIPNTYWVMENALDYTTPKLIVVDCHALQAMTKTNPTGFAQVLVSLDAFPLSVTKIKTALDLLNDPEIGDDTTGEAERRTPIELLWNFSVYHARWKELQEDDFKITASSEKGAESRIAVTVPLDTVKIDRNEKLEEDTIAIEYLQKIIEICQKRGIDVLLTFIPFPADTTAQKNANRVYDIAAEYGVNYINFLDMDLVDYDTDCYDSYSHLNPSGARKVTDYLGKYIMENYQISDERSNSEYSDWFEDYEEYKTMKKANLQAQKAWDTYLMLLADKTLDAVIEIKSPDIWNNDKFVSLVENLGIDVTDVSEAANYLLIRRGGVQAEAVALNITENIQRDTFMGLLRISHEASGGYSVYLDDTKCFAPGEDNNGGLRIYVRDSASLDTVGQAAF